MSKADQLGAGRFGSQVRGVSARRQAVAAATGVPTEGVAAPTDLPPHRISPNPDNPRSSLGDLSDLAGSLRDHGQKQAITVMNRDAYLKANPEREEDLEPDTAYVVVDGSSRLAAAREAGLSSVKVMVSDDQGATSDEILESALVANIHRQDLAELDEARALERLLKIHGSQAALARRLHRSQGWVSQRLSLLGLIPQLQARIGQEPIDLLRAVGNRPAAEQEAALERLKEERALKDAERAARRRDRANAAGSVSGGGAGESSDSSPGERIPEPRTVPAAPAPASAPDSTEAETAVEPPTAAEPVATAEPQDRVKRPAPEPQPVEPQAAAEMRAASKSEAAVGESEVGERTPRTLPYDDGVFLAHHLIRKMSPTEFAKMLRLLNEHQERRTAPGGQGN
ncbi:ParB/RepB/Spo0J family partition protein [Streptomyces sp. NPDC058045]|uniref:ParB/RepB/Spo0J family partition protein n=1 Tax=Streptomyces sp. NPDC058045 TaxID=3346311 RepID=UPI0036E5D1E5